MKLFVTIVLDGVGIGEAPDADLYGDTGSDTLGHVCAESNPKLPNLADLGLGNIRPLSGVGPVRDPQASYGKMRAVSAGKDSTSGHWELAGVLLEEPFPVYPEGFPSDLIDRFLSETNSAGVLGNRPESGTAIIDQFGDEHVKTGQPIIYTSADSVFQIAAHTEVLSPARLYEMCEITRRRVCIGQNAVGRIIARPFHGTSGGYVRISEARRDFSLRPPTPTLLNELQKRDIVTVSIGKISALFSDDGFFESHQTKSNAEGIEQLMHRIRRSSEGTESTFVWVNLIDFDQEFGHRNDPDGFASALEEFDRAIPQIKDLLPAGSRLAITADHGNDPTTASTDHSREYVPILYLGSPEVRDLSIRSSFCDHAATVAAYFDVPFARERSSLNRVEALSFEKFQHGLGSTS